METLVRARQQQAGHKAGAVRETAVIRFSYRPSSLGLILIAESTLGVCAVLLGYDHDTLQQELASRFPHARLVNGDARLVTRVVEAVEHSERPADLPLDMQGTAFQRSVWQALRKVPAGQTVTYAELARRIGHPRAVRAVGHACATNPLAVLIPCHRAVRSDGGLAGYRWGLARKRALLAREAAADVG
jgi:AraC family transcriptional regulator of adaptative response/methylated-DNA-[protein]-cysteine methyltransferase